MASYQQWVERFLSEYQPELKTSLEQQGKLQEYLETQATAMHEVKARLLAQLQVHSPHVSPQQHELEAERMVIEMFLTPI